VPGRGFGRGMDGDGQVRAVRISVSCQGHTGVNVRESFGVEHFTTRESAESTSCANRIIATAKANTTATTVAFNLRVLTRLLPV